MKKAQSFEEPLNQFTPFDRLIKVSHIFNDSQFVDRGIFYGALPYQHFFMNLD